MIYNKVRVKQLLVAVKPYTGSCTGFREFLPGGGDPSLPPVVGETGNTHQQKAWEKAKGKQLGRRPGTQVTLPGRGEGKGFKAGWLACWQEYAPFL